MLRRILLPLVLLGALAPTDARAAASYCSPTGDYCTSAKRNKGTVRLYIGTFSFRGKVDVCVVAPDRTKDCQAFTLRARPMGIFAVDARWSAHFPRKGPGTYRVTFAQAGGQPLGPAVTFALKG